MTTASTRRRWLQFGLRTLFVAVTICGLASYWLHCLSVREQARQECRRTFAAWEVDVVMAEDACDASLRLFRAEIAVPFAYRAKAAAAHLERVEHVWDSKYGPSGEWMMGVADEASLAEAKALKAKIEGYCADAARMTRDAR